MWGFLTAVSPSTLLSAWLRSTNFNFTIDNFWARWVDTPLSTSSEVSVVQFPRIILYAPPSAHIYMSTSLHIHTHTETGCPMCDVGEIMVRNAFRWVATWPVTMVGEWAVAVGWGPWRVEWEGWFGLGVGCWCGTGRGGKRIGEALGVVDCWAFSVIPEHKVHEKELMCKSLTQHTRRLISCLNPFKIRGTKFRVEHLGTQGGAYNSRSSWTDIDQTPSSGGILCSSVNLHKQWLFGEYSNSSFSYLCGLFMWDSRCIPYIFAINDTFRIYLLMCQ